MMSPKQWLIACFDRSVELVGFQETFRRLIAWSGTELEVSGSYKRLMADLKHQSVLVVSNHPSEFDSLAMFASLPEKRNYTVMGNAMWCNLSRHADRYLHPLYIASHVHANGVNFVGRLFNRLLPMPVFPYEEEKRRNIHSLALASKKLQANGLLWITPGRRSLSGSWYPGVGRILAKVSRRVFVVRLYIEGTSDWDYWRIFPLTGKVLPRVRLHFAEPYLYHPGDDPYAITTELEEHYRGWLREFLALGDDQNLPAI